MRVIALMLAVVFAATAAQAQSVPDLKGTWNGKGKSLVFGTNPHHPGSPPDPATPRVRDVEFTLVITNQDGALAWGYSFSSVANTREPMALAIAADGKSVIGSDTDGSYRLTLVSGDRMDMCYTHTGLSPSKSIVATCYMMNRRK
jgi:hypothetical protein